MSETGVPTLVVHTRVVPPASRMGPADDVAGQAQASPLWAKYGQQPGAQRREPAAHHQEAAGALGGGVAAVGAFLQSREGKKLQKEVVRGVFGMLKKRM